MELIILAIVGALIVMFWLRYNKNRGKKLENRVEYLSDKLFQLSDLRIDFVIEEVGGLLVPKKNCVEIKKLVFSEWNDSWYEGKVYFHKLDKPNYNLIRERDGKATYYKNEVECNAKGKIK